MPPRPIYRTVLADAPSSQSFDSPPNSDWELVSIKRENESDAESPVSEPLSPGAWLPVSSAPPPPATQLPAAGSTHDQPVVQSSTPVSQHFLAEYYRNGAYSDLEIVSAAGSVRSVHRIIVCSESPVLQEICNNQGPGQRLTLKYDSETLDRVLDFCYRRTYSDREFPEMVAPFLNKMTIADVRDALEAPLADFSDIQYREDCLECDIPGDLEEEEESEERQDRDGEQSSYEEQNAHNPQKPGKEQSPSEEQDRGYDTDDFVPRSCDIHFTEQVEWDTSMHAKPQDSTELPQPPYPISLFSNLKVYLAAKELQIPALQLVARERFAHSLQAHWNRFAELPALIEQVCSQTPTNDPLRLLVCRMVAASYPIVGSPFWGEIRELMGKNGQFATQVLDNTLRLELQWQDKWT